MTGGTCETSGTGVGTLGTEATFARHARRSGLAGHPASRPARLAGHPAARPARPASLAGHCLC